MQIYLVEIDAAVDNAGTIVTQRLSSGARFMTRPNETPANTAYAPRLIAPGNFSRMAWAEGTTRGASQRGYGVVELDNSDGGLDDWLNYGFDGRSVTIRAGGDAGVYPADFPILFKGVVSRVAVDWAQVKIYMVDRQGDTADKSYQLTKFAGTNSGPTGLEGLPTDLAGKPKPRLKGAVKNISAPCVNTSTLIYQIDDGRALPPMTLSAVYDKGVALTLEGSARASLAALIATAPSAGQVGFYAGAEGWFFRLGSAPGGTITCDVSEGSAAQRTAAQITYRLLVSDGGLPAADVVGVSGLDSKNSAEVGQWVGAEETTIGQVVDAVMDSVNGFVTDSRSGLIKLGRLEDPATLTPVATFQRWQIKSRQGLSISPSSDPGVGIRLSDGVNGEKARYKTSQDATAGLPVWRVILDYDRNFTVQSETDLAGAALSRIVYTKREYRSADVSDSAVLVKNPKAPEFTATTLLLSASAAATEATRQLSLRKVPRYVVRLPVEPADAAGIDLMDAVIVLLDRFGWDAGKPLVVVGITEDYGAAGRAALTTLTLWG